MEDYVIETKEIGDYRIKICRDDDAPCPCMNEDLVGLHLYSDDNNLSSSCNYEELFDTCCYSLADAVRSLACMYVPQKKFIEYINKYLGDSLRFYYDRSAHMWYLKQYYKGVQYNGSHWFESQHFTPDEVNNQDIRDELSESLGKEDFIYLLSNCQTKIAVHEWSSSGHCQGDYAEGFSYCTKERFAKMCDQNTKNWRKRAESFMESETDNVGKWMWGDVIGFVLEKKVRHTKVCGDSEKADEGDYDWEEVSSCWGYYCDEDELIKEVIDEHQLQPSITV